MLEVLQRESFWLSYYFVGQLNQVFKYWAFGIILGSLVSVFLKKPIHELMRKMKNLKLGVLGTIPASLLGIASPLCMYGTIPLVATFAKEDMREDWIASFMMSSILLNPQLIATSGMMGQTAVTIRVVACFICGVLAGVLVNIFYRKKKFFSFGKFEAGCSRDTDPNPLMRVLKNMWRNVVATGPYFLLGMVLATLYQRYVPTELTTRLFGGDQKLGVFMAATLGVPLYVCGGGTVPLIAQWLRTGMSMGAATAFMLTGPATKITNLSAVKTVLGKYHFLIYIGFSMLFAFISGTIVNWIV